MKKNILFIMCLFIGFTLNVNASNIEINGKNYDISQDINEEGYSYDSENNVLKLINYNGSNIKKEGSLNILLEGNNFIAGNNRLIEVESLTIDGDGTLNLNSTAQGIYASNIVINNVQINGEVISNLFSFDNTLLINDVAIEAESNGVLIQGGSSIQIINSYIKANCLWGFRYNASGEATIKNSKLKFVCEDECLNSGAKMSFEETKANFASKTVVTNKAKLTFDDFTQYTVSTDDINYNNSLDYKGYPYLHIESNLDSDQDDDIKLNNKEESAKYTNGQYDSKIINIENPKTGDSILRWTLIFLLSILGLLVLVVVFKRYDNRKI